MARSISPLLCRSTPRSQYEAAEAVREACACRSRVNKASRVSVRSDPLFVRKDATFFIAFLQFTIENRSFSQLTSLVSRRKSQIGSSAGLRIIAPDQIHVIKFLTPS